MILAVDSSAVTASAALFEDAKAVKSEIINAGLTHSETLMPMIKRVLGSRPVSQLDYIAVSAGPGSFTGVRIGIATVKGLAFNDSVPCVGVSTLEAIAWNFEYEDTVICAVMDARRMQFYNALFRADDGEIRRLCPDRAISLDDLREDIKKYDNVIIAGDGAELCYNSIGLKNTSLAPKNRRYQCGEGVAKASVYAKKVPASQLMPVYLRQSQAERELKKK